VTAEAANERVDVINIYGYLEAHSVSRFESIRLA